jgi:hypothetical protein
VYISLRPLVNYLIGCFSSKILYLILMVPVLLAGTRVFIFNILGVCGVPLKASFAVSDMALFFIVTLIIFTLLDGCVPVPDFMSSPHTFNGFVETVRCTGLY